MLATLVQDIKYGLRVLWKKPGFTLVAVLTMALGIGANTAIFSVVNAVLLRPLPFQEPERLVMLWGDLPQNQLGWDVLPTSAANFLDWRRSTESFEDVAAFKTWAWHVTGASEPEQIWGARASASLFPMLGTSPLLGRTFTAEEDQPNSKVVVIGYNLWQRRFGGDPHVVGQSVTLTGESYTIIGVMPQGFRFPGGANLHPGFRFSPQTEMWMPLSLTNEEAANRGTQNLAVLGRLKPGVSLEQAGAEMRAIARRLEQQYPNTNEGMGIKLVRLHEQVVGNVRPALLILLGTVGFVLLIACANVANLLLARTTTRRKEISIRTALGASRWRLIRQLLTESTLLALMGGVLGFLLALWGVDALVSLIPEDVPRAREISVDAVMLGFTLMVSVLTGLVFGLIPALQASHVNVNESLKEGQKGAGGTGRSRVRNLLVVSEIALALVLLIGAGLLIRSFLRLQQVDPGFDPHNVLTAEVFVPFLPPSKYAEPGRQADFFRQLTERVRSLPGVESAGAVETLPLSGAIESSSFLIEGRGIPPADQQPQADYTEITPDYFRTMAIPLVGGRSFTDEDKRDAPGVVIINNALARRFFANENPLGRRVTFSNPQGPIEWLSIVGVVGDTKQTALATAAQPAVFLPQSQSPTPSMTLVVRAPGVDVRSLTEAVRREVKNIDRDLPVTDIRTMDEVLAASVSQRRFNMMLLAVFAAVALVLATVGIFGVMNYSVTQRTHEIGVRIALGAQPGDILKMVVGQGMLLALVGVVIGVFGALLLTRVMSSLLFGTSATDPLTFIGISLLIVVVALVACLIPARRATRVDPMLALRYE